MFPMLPDAGTPRHIGAPGRHVRYGLSMVALANRVYQTSHAPWAVAARFPAVTVPMMVLSPRRRSFLNHRTPEDVAGRVFALYSGVLFGAASLAMAARRRATRRQALAQASHS
jgi:hypothetical protein